MKLLLKAAYRVRRNSSLLLITVVTLIGLTLVNQMEMLALGLLSEKGAEKGADFFTLFASKDAQGDPQSFVRYEEIEERWEKIDSSQTGVITKEEATTHLVKEQKANFLVRVIDKLKSIFAFEESLKACIIFLLGVALFKACFLFFSRYTTQVLSIRISRDLREQYFDHIQHLSMSFYQKHNIGSLASRVVGDSSQISVSINAFITNYLHAPFTILSTFSLCFFLSWQLSMVIFFGLPLVIFPVIFVTRRVKRITRQLQKNQERFTSVLIDFLAGIQTVKIFAMELFSFKKYKEQNDQMSRLESKTAKYDLLTRPVLHTITTFCLASVIIVGLHILEMRISELVLFVGLLYHFYEPVKKFAEGNTQIQKGVVAAERMYEVLHLKPKITDCPSAIALQEFKEGIEFDRVWFRYEEEWVLKDLSFFVKKGETVALVGKTGVGKSTIVQLLPRLYDIQRGEIRIDGKAIQDYTQKSLREQIAFVSQKPFLFYDTIGSNIAYGKPYSKKEIIEASKKAHAHEFIKHLPQLYDTMLAETGKNFSGGQQQRIAIARALVKKSPILIFDEATSSLDAISEHKVKRAIEELHGEVTQILIAHRLSTIESADRIIYLEEGRKIGEGTKDELLESCPPFKLMWDIHFQTKEALKPYLV